MAEETVMKKKIISAFLMGIVIIVAIFAFVILNQNKEGLTERKTIRIGVSLYRFNDTFISNIKKEM